jgi:hypothetical protein
MSVDDAQPRADLHGVRITAASLNAARTVLSRMDAPPIATQAPAGKAPAAPASSTERAQRRVRTAQPPLDAESRIKNVVERIRGEGNAESERLRATMRKAVDVLRAATG